MNAQSKLHAWLPTLALALAAATAAPAAQAQNGTYVRGEYWVPSPPLVEFQYRPQWVPVTRSNVLMVRAAERPYYDMFSYGSNYYIYNDGYWYRSSRWDGSYVAIDARDVPVEIHSVPEAEWHSYPPGWAYYDNSSNMNGRDYQYNGYNNGASYDIRSAPDPPEVYFSRNPRWVTVPGTRVLVLSQRDRQDYDILRYGSWYYIYDNGYWYRSNRLNGTFVAIDARKVPSAFQQVPASQWRNYPQSWRKTRTYNSSYYRQKQVVRTRNR
jgi:hypothetical protein